jgi:hypothetical protein
MIDKWVRVCTSQHSVDTPQPLLMKADFLMKSDFLRSCYLGVRLDNGSRVGKAPRRIRLLIDVAPRIRVLIDIPYC